jgi:hypothetical protein
MLSDRLVGALCIGLAAVAATWDGHATWRVPRSGPRTAAHAGPARNTTATTFPTEPTAATTTTAPGSSASTAPARSGGPAGEDDRAVARRAVLVPGDLPSGFVTLRPAPGDDEATGDGPFEHCLGSDAGALTAAIRAKAASAQFARDGTGTVLSSAAVLDRPVSAEKIMKMLGSSSARSCFEGLINARLARNPNLPEDVRGTLRPIGVGRVGDQTIGFRFDVRLRAEDVEEDPDPSEEEISYLADFVFVRRGRVLALVEMAGLRVPFDRGVAEAMLSSLAGHIPST